MRPGSEWAMPEAELEKLPGFGRDMEKNRAEARKLLAEAGYPNGFKVVLKNRNVKLPYQDFAVFLIQEWRKIGIEVEHRPLETAAWFSDGQDTGNFELIVAPDRRVHGRARPVPRPLRDRAAPRTGAASPIRRSTTSSRARRGPSIPVERKRLINEMEKLRARERLLHARALVVAEPRALEPR